jgi:hypothetical protein
MKLAILLSGRLTTYEEGYKDIMEKLVQGNEVDFYVGVSNEKANAELEKGFKALFKPVSYKKTAKGELTGINWEQLKTNKSTTPIKKNIMYMWKNRLNVLNQLKKSKKKYDWIISTRVDERYARKLNYSKLVADKLNLPKTYGTSKQWKKAGDDWEGLQDQVAIGKKPLIEKYLSVYPNLKKYIKDVGNYKHLKNYDAEKLMNHHIIMKDIPVNRFDFKFYLVRGEGGQRLHTKLARTATGFKTD